MSLIACLAPDTFPVLIADTLMSSINGNEDVSLPTIGPLHRIIDSKTGFKTAGMGEKLIKLNEFILIAWAGSNAAAQYILVGLKSRFGVSQPNLIEITGFLNQKYPKEMAEVCLIISVREASNTINSWHHRCREIIMPPIGRVWVAGTGSGKIESLLKGSPSEIYSSQTNPLRAGTVSALIICGLFLADELRTGDTIAHSFGAAYEIATFNAGKAIKLDDYAFVFWFGRRAHDGLEFQGPIKMIRRYERDDQACFHCVEFDTSKPETRFANQWVHMIKPSFSARVIPHTKSDVPVPNTQWQVNVFLLDPKDGEKPQASVVVNFRHNRLGHLVQFQFNENETRGQLILKLDEIHKALTLLSNSG